MATVASPEMLPAKLPASALVWLRLDNARPALEQLTLLRRSTGAAFVIALAVHPDDEEALELFSAGVRGYCNAHATAANLRQVAKVVQAGGLWIGETLMKRLLSSTQAAFSRIQVAVPPREVPPAAADRLSVLTEREREVADAVAGGASNKEIGRQLGITERTVKAHTGSIFQKLKARDRLHLALIVTGRGSA